MEDKYTIIILAAVVVVIAIAGYIFATGMLNGNGPAQTSPLKTEFMDEEPLEQLEDQFME